MQESNALLAALAALDAHAERPEVVLRNLIARVLRHNLRALDLTGLDLSDLDLRGYDLTAANLHGTNLSGTKLAGADCTNASFTGAILTGADLSGALVLVAEFTGAIGLTTEQRTYLKGRGAYVDD